MLHLLADPLLATLAVTGRDSTWLRRCNPPAPLVPGVRCDVHGFFEQRIELYCKLPGKQRSQLRKVSTPSIDDHHFSLEDFDNPGQLANDLLRS